MSDKEINLWDKKHLTDTGEKSLFSLKVRLSFDKEGIIDKLRSNVENAYKKQGVQGAENSAKILYKWALELDLYGRYLHRKGEVEPMFEDLILFCLANGAKPDAKTLQYAIRFKHKRTVGRLLKENPHLAAKFYNGVNALMVAAGAGYDKLADMCVAADPECLIQISSDGQSAADIAKRWDVAPEIAKGPLLSEKLSKEAEKYRRQLEDEAKKNPLKAADIRLRAELDEIEKKIRKNYWRPRKLGKEITAEVERYRNQSGTKSKASLLKASNGRLQTQFDEIEKTTKENKRPRKLGKKIVALYISQKQND